MWRRPGTTSSSGWTGTESSAPGYIARAVELLDETGAANVGGVMEARGVTAFEQAVAHTYTSRLGLGGGAFHLGDVPAGPADTVFLGVFRKAELAAVGGFDESMWRAQDWELNYRLRRAGRLVWFSPELRVTYRPRSRVRDLAKQMFETGRWRREVMRRHPDTASVRYLAPPLAVTAIGVGTALGLARPRGRGAVAPARLRRPCRLPRRRVVGYGAAAGRLDPVRPSVAAHGARRDPPELGSRIPGRTAGPSRRLTLCPNKASLASACARRFVEGPVAWAARVPTNFRA